MYKKKKKITKNIQRDEIHPRVTRNWNLSRFRKWAAIEGGDETGVERKRANVEGKRERGIK